MPNPAVLDKPAANGKPAAAPAFRNPFTRAAREVVEGAFHDRSTTITAAQQQVTDIDVPAFGYARSVLVVVTASGGAGGAANVAAQGDAPWIALTNIVFSDVNGRPLLGPLSGYDLYLANKWGAYGNALDPATAPEFSAVATGAGASGNFTFALRIPLEVGLRDGLCALPNMNSASAYKVAYTINDSASIYSVAPATTLPSVRVQMYLEAWSQPDPSDPRGVPNDTQPPMPGSTQHWSKATFNLAQGEQRVRMTRVGNMIRQLIFVARVAAGTRTTTDFPTTLRVELDSKVLFSWSQVVQRRYMWERSQLTLGANDTGVFVLDFCHDLDGRLGHELRDQWLPTTQATRLEIIGTFGATISRLDVLTNDVALSGGAQLPNG